MTNSAPSFEIYKEAQEVGLIVRLGMIEYRGQEISFISDPLGNQCFAQWRGKLYDLGLNNIYYKEDMCRVVDRELDLISTFRNCSDFVGAKLEWFRNGGFRDIRLTYKDRILKVFLVAGEINEIDLISTAENLLRNSGLLDDDVV